jgi:hypothetical protein
METDDGPKAFCTRLHGDMWFCDLAVNIFFEVRVNIIVRDTDESFWTVASVVGLLHYTEENDQYKLAGTQYSHIVFPARYIIGHEYDEVRDEHILSILLHDLYYAYRD